MDRQVSTEEKDAQKEAQVGTNDIFFPLPNDLCGQQHLATPAAVKCIYVCHIPFQGLSQPPEDGDFLMTRQGYEDYAQGSLDVNEDYGEGSHKKKSTRVPGYVRKLFSKLRIKENRVRVKDRVCEMVFNV